jgi:hypothetical protein
MPQQQQQQQLQLEYPRCFESQSQTFEFTTSDC